MAKLANEMLKPLTGKGFNRFFLWWPRPEYDL